MAIRHLLAGMAISVAFAASPAQAVPIDIDFSGHGISGIGSDYFPTAAGTPWSLNLVYESTTPDVVANPDVGDYFNAVLSAVLTIGNTTLTGGPGISPGLYNDLLIRSLRTDDIGWAFDGVPTTVSADRTAFGLSRYNLPASTLTTDALFTLQEQWNALLGGNFFADFFFDTDARGLDAPPFRSRIDGIITSITVNSPSVVPEPATFALFCLGLAGMILGARKRNVGVRQS